MIVGVEPDAAAVDHGPAFRLAQPEFVQLRYVVHRFRGIMPSLPSQGTGIAQRDRRHSVGGGDRLPRFGLCKRRLHPLPLGRLRRNSVWHGAFWTDEHP
jgi:hypothetical protein